ncbi:ABC transporter permease [Adhaeribacter soli]|uniref:FtsX-like permease family protein n=1 Tax=Adhaeribacter soli TaxID=2607655 RepID=A0A5N1J8A4_9BACT|nr:ABC transporter permease [Adhaeribacter soli]KAA9345565.1 FtsX-like permease family protein [Adhaeribacter soli]
MLYNYLKIGLRNLMRHKVFSLINIFGLALGMTCCIFILLWVKDELSFDRFHKHTDNLVRIISVQHYPGSDDLITQSGNGMIAPSMARELPEVERAIRLSWNQEELFSLGEKAFKVDGLYADTTFFEAFTFPLLYGDSKLVLNEPNSVVISDSVALKFFGSTNVVGKVFKTNNSKSYKVTGVVQKPPKNSTIQFDFVKPYKDYLKENQWLNDWDNYGMRNFLQLKPGTDLAAFNRKVAHYPTQPGRGKRDIDVFVQPLKDAHLYSDFRPGKTNSGGILYVRLFSAVAGFILLIACINFMNLATARSSKRAKEVGVRKAIGAAKSQIITQFMLESILIAFLALIVAVNLIGLLLPAFNELTQKAVALDLSNPNLILLLVAVALFTGIVSGSYPAFFLSAFNPVAVLKGTAKSGKGAAFFRKGLVVFQFVLSGILIVSTLVVYLQMEFIRSKDIGLNRENVLYVPMEGDLAKNYDVIKQELLQQPAIVSVAGTSQNPIEMGNNTPDVEWEGKDPKADLLIDIMNVDYDVLQTFDIKLKDGRTFSKAFGADTANYLVNEEAIRLMQLKNPVGNWLKVWDVRGSIIGVVKDFQNRKMQQGLKPLVIRLTKNKAYYSYLFVRTSEGKTSEALKGLEQTLAKHNPAFPFEYKFLDDEFEKMYTSEAIIVKLSNYFATIAIFISCLGLFGLALFTAEQRTKEIGIRKVLGASVSRIVFMLSKDFLKLVLLANIIAWPLSWYLMHKWLEDYAYRTELSWWIFALAAIATMLIALFTVSFQAIKTAIANPVTSLRSE